MQKSSKILTGLGALAAGAAGGLWLGRQRVAEQLLDLPSATHEYTIRRGVQIVMPDGERLVHDHFRPNLQTPLPTILVRTPYGRSRSSATGFFKQLLVSQYAARGYHVILQDTRGRYDSTGEFEPYIYEPDDGKATIDWIVSQPWSDGQVGMVGQSYVGFVTFAAAARDEGNQHLKAIFPIITQARLGAMPEHAYPLDLALRWLFFLDSQRRDDLSFVEKLRRMADVDYQNRFLEAGFHTLPLQKAPERIFGRTDPIFDKWVAHPDEDDPYWQELDHRASVKDAPPAHFVGGWYDLFIDGQLDDYQAQVAAGLNPYLTVGPWTHMEPGNQAMTLGESIRWFDKHMKGIDQVRPNPVRLFVMGTKAWREFEQWPPRANESPCYLHPGGALSFAPAPPNARPSHYRYDPQDPTPSVGGALLSGNAGPMDNRELEAREDVLTFTTAPLDADVEVIGHPKLSLFVRTSAVSTDFFGRLCDVHPDGKSINICDAIYRIKPARDRQTPEGGYHLCFNLSPTAHCFKAGHRIRLQVSSGAFPRFQRNLGLDEHFMFAQQMVVQDQTICHDADHPSSLTLPISTQ